MATNASGQRTGPSLRPRIVDVSEMRYDRAASLIDPDTNAYLERKGGETTLVIR